ncbi:MAG TPA: APC family permease [Polyangia bacterium]|nr:APC family permease [Polyangia bacterium]
MGAPSGSPAGRPLGGWSLLALGLNGVIGVGIFFTPGLIAGLVPGMSGVWVYAVTAAVLAPVGAVYATLGERFDADGGPYLWARAAFGPGAAFAIGWIAYVSAVLSTAAVVAGLGHALAGAWGLGAPGPERLVALATGGALMALTAAGLRPSARIWSALTVSKLLPLMLLVGAFVWRAPDLVPRAPASAPGGWGRAMLLAVFALQGFEIVPVPRGHARGGARVIGAATLGALELAAVLYAAIQAACVRALPDLPGQAAPLVAAAGALGGGWLARIVAVGADLSAIGIAFGMAAMTPRYLVALASDELGPRLGPWLRAESQGQVPLRALAVTAAAVAVLVSGRALGGLFVLSGLAVLAQYAASALALAKLAWTRAHGLRRRDLIWAPASAAAVALMVPGAQPGELAILGGVLAAGLGVWGVARLSARSAKSAPG